jgi:hypothetical protein
MLRNESHSFVRAVGLLKRKAREESSQNLEARLGEATRSEWKNKTTEVPLATYTSLEFDGRTLGPIEWAETRQQ